MGERRHHARERLSTVAYVSFGEAGGGILLDISESGFGAQAIGHFAAQQLIACQVELTGTPYRLECGGKIVWADARGQLGYEFLGLSDAARTQLRHWLSIVREEAVAPLTRPVAPAAKPRTPPVKREPRPAHKPHPRQNAPAPPTQPISHVPPPGRVRPGPPAVPGLPAALQGPFPLTAENVELYAPSTHGVYVLGERIAGGEFEVLRVGRSDNVQRTLAQYLGHYRQFQCVGALSEIDAWDRECQLYHLHRPRHNSVHPVRRDDWDCPVCHGFS